MDISIGDANYIKIRGKHCSLAIDPSEKANKSTADAVVLLEESNKLNFKNVEGYRVVIKDPGEYEVSQAMVSGKKTDGGIVYKLVVDNINIVLGKASDAAKVLDKIDSCQVLILNADSDINQSVISSLEPKTVVLYGEKKLDVLKNLNKENITPVSKFTLTREKLSEGMEVVVLE